MLDKYGSSKTFASACEWIKANRAADNYFLMVEAFDPHEPFDCPREYLEMYGDVYNGSRYEWLGYASVNGGNGSFKKTICRYADHD